MIAKLCQTFGGLPEAGGVLDQPLGLLVLGSRLLDYERAYYAVREADRAKQPPPPDALSLVMRVQAMIALGKG